MANVAEKLVAVEGNITELRLGLSGEDYTNIAQTVSVVFHVAATVRFNEPLTEAIFMNTRGTREVVNLCLQMKQLAVRYGTLYEIPIRLIRIIVNYFVK